MIKAWKRKINLQELGLPLSGLAKDIKLTDTKLIRAISLMLAADHEVILAFFSWTTTHLHQTVWNTRAGTYFGGDKDEIASPDIACRWIKKQNVPLFTLLIRQGI